MTDLNTFNTVEDDRSRDAGATLAAAVVGMVALAAAWPVTPRLTVALSWVLVFAGVTVAVLAPRRRAIALGLVVSGAAPPLALFAYFWVAISAVVVLG